MSLNPRPIHVAACGARPPLLARLPQFVRGPSPAVAARRLSALRIAIAGCGSVGLGIVDRIGRMGLAGLLCADPARFKSESLITHPVITPGAVGRPKAAFAARHAARLNPGMDTRFVAGALQEVPLADLRDVDLIVVATDNLESEVELGSLARQLGVPLVRAAVEGQTLTTQVAVYSNAEDSRPCPACLFGPAEWARVGEHVRFSCTGDASADQPGTPTMSVPHLCAMAADYCVQQILRLVLGLGEPVADTMLTVCGYGNQVSVARLIRSESCPCDHHRSERVFVARSLASATPYDILAASGFDARLDGSLEVPGFLFIESLPCACPQAASLRRFISTAVTSVRCPECRQVFPLTPFYSSPAAGARQLGEVGQRTPLGQLGARHARCVLTMSTDRRAIVFEENANA